MQIARCAMDNTLITKTAALTIDLASGEKVDRVADPAKAILRCVAIAK